MKNPMQTVMSKAMRLVQQKEVLKATEAIQRVLHGKLPAQDEPSTTQGWRVVEPDSEPSRSAGDQNGRGRRPGSASAQPGVAQPGVAHPGVDSLPGRFISGTFRGHTGTRNYKLYLPSGYLADRDTGRDAAQTLPLLVMLHGCQQNPTDFAAGTAMNQLAEKQGFFVLYPEQPHSANSMGCWNWFEQREQQRDQGEPSILAGMTRTILRSHPVDGQRVWTAGLSAGGAMALILAATHPDLFSAVGVHSGLAYAAAHDLPRAYEAMRKGASKTPRLKVSSALAARVPRLIVFHGDRDHTVNLHNAQQIVEQWVALLPAGQRTRLQSRVVREQPPGGRAFERMRLVDPDLRRTVIERWTIHGGGHAWSGGSSSGSFTDPNGPNASRAMLDFFTEGASDAGGRANR